MSDEPRDETPASTPPQPTPNDRSVPPETPSDGSAPWERPRRWNNERLDATRVDELLARLGSDDGGTPRRRRRSDRTPIEHTAPEPAAAETPVPETSVPETPAAPDVPEAPPAAQPPLAPDEPGPIFHHETVEPQFHVEPSASPTETSDAVDEPTSGTPANDEPAVPAELAGLPPVGVSKDPVTGVSTYVFDDRAGYGGRAGSYDDAAETTALPVAEGDLTEQPGADARTELLPRITDAPADQAEADDVRENLRAALVAGDLPTEAMTVAADLPTEDAPDAARHGQRRKLMLAGRSIIALFSALVLIYVGAYWVVLDNTTSAGTQVDSGLRPTPEDKPPVTTSSVVTTEAAPGSSAAPVVPVVNYKQENFLIFGSDSRSGDNSDPSNDDGTLDGVANSDTMMVAHISADRSQVSIVSLPRDLWIDDLSCETWDEPNQRYTGTIREASPGGQLHLNSSYSIGGAKCLVDAVEQVTGLQITRFLGIGFAGFQGMVDALGGVVINACQPIIDGELGTILSTAGEQKISGTQALYLARARKVSGPILDDLGRIHRQQVLLSAILNQAKSADVLLNPIKLNGFVQSFFKDTIRDNVEVGDLLTLADSMGDLDPARVTFYTLPTFDAGDGRSLDLDTTNSTLLFNALINDTPVPGAVVVPPPTTETPTPTEATSAASSSAAASTTSRPATSTTRTTPPAPPTISIAPADTDVRLVNAADRDGLSTTTSASLNELGFDITEDDLLRLDPDQTQTGITVRYAPSNLAAALTVASAVPGSTLEENAGLGSQVELVLGTDFDGTVTAVSVGDTLRDDLAEEVAATGVTTEGSTSANSSEAPTTNTPTSPAVADTASSTAQSSTADTEIPSSEIPDVAKVNAADAGCM